MGKGLVPRVAGGLALFVAACALFVWNGSTRGGGSVPSAPRGAAEARPSRGEALAPFTRGARREPAVDEDLRAEGTHDEPGTSPRVERVGVELFGAALDGEGRPLADLALELGDARGPLRETRTDADGRFRFEGVASGRHWLAALDPRVLADGAAVEIPEGVRAVERTLVLELGRPLAGRVVDTDGQPLAEALVTPWRADERGARLDRRCAVTTGEDGCFALGGGRLGPTRVVIEREGYRAWRGELDDGEPLEVVLEPTLALRGSVRLASGEPAAGSRVRASAHDANGPEASALVGASGAFVLDGLAEGRVQVLVEGRHGALGPLEVVLADGMEPVELVLPAGRALDVRVLDPEGGAVAGVRVIALEPGERRALRTARTDADGRARLVELPAESLEITAEDARFLFPRVAPREGEELVLRGTQGARLGVALDADARWVATLRPLDLSQPARTLLLDPGVELALGPLASGRWALRLVGPFDGGGEDADGLVPAAEDAPWSVRREITLRAGVAERVELTAPRVARVEGLVRSARAPDLVVEIRIDAGEPPLARAPVDADGRYRFAALPPGGYRIGLSAPGGGTWLDPAPLVLEPGTAAERALAPPEQTCTIVPLGPDGRLVRGASALLASAVPAVAHGGRSDARGTRVLSYGSGPAGADEWGRIELRLLSEGRRVVLLRAPGYRELRLEIPPTATTLTATFSEGDKP